MGCSLQGPQAKAGQKVEPPLTFTATCRGLGSLGIPDTWPSYTSPNAPWPRPLYREDKTRHRQLSEPQAAGVLEISVMFGVTDKRQGWDAQELHLQFGFALSPWASVYLLSSFKIILFCFYLN